MTSDEHPDPDRLAAFRHGRLTDAEIADIGSHLDSCPSCVAVAESSADGDPLLDTLRSALAEPPLEAIDRPGRVLAGRFELLEPLGQGGMGSVWKARQLSPVRRFVAVKLIRSGMQSRRAVERFGAERQALARMDHPNIAKVHDAGAIGDGRHFLVMELVAGAPVTQFCDERRMPVADRLRLFIPICEAIQHAHQKGVIHRDIKPGNVLVLWCDDRPSVKVIDFGVAKSTRLDESDSSTHTAFGTIIGTPEYMSPEQAGMQENDVDTRSDIYSLGALLYELLTGGPPHCRGKTAGDSLLDLLETIRRVEPPHMSDRLRQSPDLATLAGRRGVEPDKLPAAVRGELDCIAAKCLEHDRDRRYQTANALRADIERHLTGQPVRAVPPTTGYRLRKFLRNHRGPVAATGLVVAALVAGIIGTSIGLMRARNAESEARQLAEEADAHRLKAEDNLRRVSLAHVDTIGLVVDTAFRIKNDAPESAYQALAGRIDRIANQPDLGEADDEEIRFRLRILSAHAYRTLGQYPQAIEQAERALKIAERIDAPSRPYVFAALIDLALLNRLRGESALAATYRQRAQTAFDAMRDPTSDADRAFQLEMLQYLREWAEETELATALAERLHSLAVRQGGAGGAGVMSASNQLAWANLRQGRTDEAVAIAREMLTVLEREPDRDSKLRHQLIRDAQQLFINASFVDGPLMDTLKRLLDPEPLNPSILAVRGRLLLSEGHWLEAEPILRECHDVRQKREPELWTTFNTSAMLGVSLLGQKRYAEAEPLLLSGVQGMNRLNEKIPAAAKARLTEAIDGLIRLYEATDRPAEAAKWRNATGPRE